MRRFLAAFGFFFLFALASPAFARISQSNLVDALAQETKSRYQTSEVEVEWKAPPLAMLLGGTIPEDLGIKVPQTARLMGDGAIPIQLYRGNLLFRTIYPRVDIRVYGFALVATTGIKRGDPFSEGNVETKRKHLKDLPLQPLTRMDALAGARALRDIPSGTVLTNGLIDLPSLIKSGSMVTVQVVSGDLTILSSGQALSDGQVGQLIRLRNPASKREFSARVLGEGLAEVKLED